MATLEVQEDLQVIFSGVGNPEIDDTKVPYTGAVADVNLGSNGLIANDVATDIVTFDTTYSPTNSEAVGSVFWNDTNGTVDVKLKGGIVVLPIGETQVARVVNKTSSNLLKSNYNVVRFNGAQGQRPKIALAQSNNDANSAETAGLVAENIDDNQEGFIITSGIIDKINTTGSLQSETWVDGDLLWLSGTTAGRITNIKPTAPNHLVLVGFVVYAHATQGKIYVVVQNGYELDELHNVSITSPTNGQVLSYESSTQLWKNSSSSVVDNAITNAKLADMATATVKGRATAGTGDPEDLAIDSDLSTTSANNDTIPSAKAVKDYVDLLELKTRIRNAGLLNGYIIPSVASNNLTLAVSTSPSSVVAPTSTNPVYVWIGNTLRSITSSLSISANAGTNWFNSGSAELATREIDYFAYIGYNATDGVVLGFSRIPYARLYSDFNTTTTNEKYARISTITNAAAGDNYVNIGRFAATLSATASFNWSVPTFSNANLIQEPVYETRWLTYSGGWTSFANPQPALGNATVTANYKIIGNNLIAKTRILFGSTSTFGTNTWVFKYPLTPNSSISDASVLGNCSVLDEGTAYYHAMARQLLGGIVMSIGGNANVFNSTNPHTWVSTDIISFQVQYEI